MGDIEGYLSDNILVWKCDAMIRSMPRTERGGGDERDRHCCITLGRKNLVSLERASTKATRNYKSKTARTIYKMPGESARTLPYLPPLSLCLKAATLGNLPRPFFRRVRKENLKPTLFTFLIAFPHSCPKRPVTESS